MTFCPLCYSVNIFFINYDIYSIYLETWMNIKQSLGEKGKYKDFVGKMEMLHKC